MYTISQIIADINRGCAIHNMNEDCFSYRIIYYVNGNGTSRKYCIDSTYDGLRKTLENIIRENISLTNSVVLAAVTTLKNGKCVSLLSRSYGFSLEEYFMQLTGKKRRRNNTCNRFINAV